MQPIWPDNLSQRVGPTKLVDDLGLVHISQVSKHLLNRAPRSLNQRCVQKGELLMRVTVRMIDPEVIVAIWSKL